MLSNKLPLQFLILASRHHQMTMRSLSCVNICTRQTSLLKRQRSCELQRKYTSLHDIEKDVFESFVKKLFKAEIDMNWVFPFPSFDGSKELNAFNDRLQPIQDFFAKNTINSAQIDQDAEIPEELIEELTKLRLFGITIPQEHGGMGLNKLEYTRLSEVLASADVSVYMMLASHNLLGAMPLLTYGSEEQRKKYLHKMASGEIITSFCCNEASCGSDITTMKTRATLSEDGDFYLLSGEKTSINNGAIADLMIVFAKTEAMDVNDVTKDVITAFLVERDFGGIYNGPQEDKMGMRGLNTTDVMFDETPVPICNILGEVGQGFRIATDTMNDARLGLVTGMTGPMRDIFQDLTRFASHRKQFGKYLKDFPLIQDKFFTMSQNTYAMESMCYLTMGKFDEATEKYMERDLSVESAITKVFCSEKALENANECMQVVGYRAYTKTFPYERLARDARMLTLTEGTSEVLKLYIALSCLTSAQKHLNERMRQRKVGTLRQQITALVDTMRDERGAALVAKGLLRKKIPSFGLTAPHQTLAWLDPHLSELGKLFELTVQSFYHRMFTLISWFGQNINQEQLHLHRVAEITILLYSVTAVIARCNKSLLMGLRHRHQEYVLAYTYVGTTLTKCQQLLEQIQKGYTKNPDKESARVGSELLEDRRYTIAHPLELEHKFIEHPDHLEQLENLKTLPEK